MADGEPVGPDELAERTGTDPRYVREWLSNQAASGYVNYDPGAGTFSLSPEQAFALAQEDSPAFVPGAFQVATALIKDEEKIGARSSAGTASAGTSTTTTCSRHRALLPSRVRGEPRVVVDPGARRGAGRSLQAGARVADVGCGHGASTILMAQAYPALGVRRLRLPRRLDRARSRGGRGSRAGRPGHGSRSRRQGVPGGRVRPGGDVRLPARHGRSGRRRRARAAERSRRTGRG